MIFAEIFYDYNDEEASKNGGAIASELLTTTIILGVLKLIDCHHLRIVPGES